MAPNAQSLFLILSNAAFLLPAALALQYGLLYEGAVYTLMCFVSAMYHVVDTKTASFLHYKTLQTLDFYSAFMMITRTAMMVTYNTSYSETNTGHFKRNSAVKQVVNVTMDMIGLLCVLEDVNTKMLLAILSTICLLMVGISLVFFRDNLDDIDIPDLITGAFVICVATVFYFAAPPDGYWWAHSLWHIFAAAGVALMVESLNKRWTLVRWICSACATERRRLVVV